MRTHRFFTERTNLTLNSSVKLPERDNKHIRKVLRLKKGDKITIFNGEKEYEAELNIVRNDVVTAKILSVLKSEDFSNENKVDIVLFQSLLRAGKFDFIVEKTTELGVDNIFPVEAEFSQTKIDIAQRKIDRWVKIGISAAKQSERITLPEIEDPIKLYDILELREKFDEIFVFTLPRDANLKVINLKDHLSTIKLNKKRVGLLVGPEGGFSPKEHEFFVQNNFTLVSVGPTVLRSETAAITYTALLQYIFNS